MTYFDEVMRLVSNNQGIYDIFFSFQQIFVIRFMLFSFFHECTDAWMDASIIAPISEKKKKEYSCGTLSSGPSGKMA